MIARFASSGETVISSLMHRPYLGNRAPPFFDFQTGNQIESLVQASQNSNFARLIIDLYVQARGEMNGMFRIFRFWSIVEMIAKRHIPATEEPLRDIDGKLVLNEKGEKFKGKSDLVRIFKYLQKIEIGAHYSSTEHNGRPYRIVMMAEGESKTDEPADIAFSLFQFVRATTAIRNDVAHEGDFNPANSYAPGSPKALAAKLLTGPFTGYVGSQVAAIARLAVLREMDASIVR